MADRISPTILHASCVAVGDAAVLILGASGAGKSSLALQLMAYGATLVSDDRTEVFIEDGNLRARAPSAISGLVEARGVGILRAESCGSATLELAVDLDRTETARLPRLHTSMILDRDLPCLHKIEGPYFPAAILQYLKAGRQEPR